MPRVFDNIQQPLLPALRNSLEKAERADFCVGYFNLRGWKNLDDRVEQWAGGDGKCCRLLIGMQKSPEAELRAALSVTGDGLVDNAEANRARRQLAEEFREQLTLGTQSNEDEEGLRRLAAQIRARKVVVKLFLRHPLHAKLYLLFRPHDRDNPITGYLGSSNLTFAGLLKQGELNVDVLDHDAAKKLAHWFEDRWNENFCVDISDELAQTIEESWARETLIPPFHIYVKMAYHLSQEARAGLTEFQIPKGFRDTLFDFQTAAVNIAAHHVNKRGGVLMGDVVGLGKTLMATALASIFEEDQLLETLIICPKNLTAMWEDYRERYGLRGKVLPSSVAIKDLPDLRPYRLVLIDESHNLRNRESKTYAAIRDYIQRSSSKVILLSATPYNKAYTDLSSQLRLFVEPDQDIGIRPERLLHDIGETEFIRRYQCPVRSLEAFEKSEHPDDWRELMRLYLVRRTRGFIQQHYAETDAATGRKFLRLGNGDRSYFPQRIPKTAKFPIDDGDAQDQYARLYAEKVVDAVNSLRLPRYGLGNYERAKPAIAPTAAEKKVLEDLSRAGKRLMGFCRTNLFKRLESSGYVFLWSVERHILRNEIFLHAIDKGLPLPIGTQDAGLLDERLADEDAEAGEIAGAFDDDQRAIGALESEGLHSEANFRLRAAEVYERYRTAFKSRFKWLSAGLFTDQLRADLQTDVATLLSVLHAAGTWRSAHDAKLAALHDLLVSAHPAEKVIVFTQFADTVRYLETQLKAAGIRKLAGVTGQSANPTEVAWRFSPRSNGKTIAAADQVRVVVATDVLSEGQNLQDCAIVVNYDLPWAIIRLIQRAGRVDRIGQQSEQIRCYTFLPAEGVERIIRLRERVRTRLKENGEVIGGDDTFFEDDSGSQTVWDLYHEKAGSLDDDDDTEVDLASYAYQIWKNATAADPTLEKTIPSLPAVVYATQPHKPSAAAPEGVLVYVRTSDDNDALAWIDRQGKSVTESQFAILRAAECTKETPALARHEGHHSLVAKGIELIAKEERTVGGQLGRPSGARFRTYERLKAYAGQVKGTLFDLPELAKALDEIYRYPLRQSAADALNRQLKLGIGDQELAKLVLTLRDDDRLCVIEEAAVKHEPRIICSMGLAAPTSHP